jgi:hypothetical protein
MTSDILQSYRNVRNLRIGNVIANDEGRLYRAISFECGDSKITLLLYAEDDDPSNIEPR